MLVVSAFKIDAIAVSLRDLAMSWHLGALRAYAGMIQSGPYKNNSNMKLSDISEDSVGPKGILAPAKDGKWPTKCREIIEGERHSAI